MLLIQGCSANQGGFTEEEDRQQTGRQVQAEQEHEGSQTRDHQEQEEHQEKDTHQDGSRNINRETGQGEAGQPVNSADRSENKEIPKDDLTNNFLIESSIIKYGDSILISRSDGVYRIDDDGKAAKLFSGISSSQLFARGQSLYLRQQH